MQTEQPGNCYDLVLDSPLGRLGVCYQKQSLTGLHYIASTVPLQSASTAFERKITSQLTRFFSDPTYRFTLALDMRGTEFQCRVWDALRQIPVGQTLTYGELAEQLGSGARAVGNACRNNPVSVVVPCHRVVSATGLGGYSGKTDGREISRKQWLLRHEGNTLPALKSAQGSPHTLVYSNKQRTLHV